MRKLLSTAVVLGLSGLLLGCPAKTGTKTTGTKTDSASATATAKTADVAKSGDAKSEAPATEKKSVDLSHVKVGQVYVYDMDASGTKMVMKYVVTEVTDTTVKYDTITVVAGTENKSPSSTEWAVAAPVEAAPAATPAATDTKISNETIEAAGQKWECMVSDTNGSKAWVPMKGGVQTFPPFIKTESAASKMTLSKIE